MDAKDLEKLFRKTSQFDQTLGMNFIVKSAGEVEYTMTIDSRHLSFF